MDPVHHGRYQSSPVCGADAVAQCMDTQTQRQGKQDLHIMKYMKYLLRALRVVNDEARPCAGCTDCARILLHPIPQAVVGFCQMLTTDAGDTVWMWRQDWTRASLLLLTKNVHDDVSQ